MMRYPQDIFSSQLELFLRINDPNKPFPKCWNLGATQRNNHSDYFIFPLQTYLLNEFRIGSTIRYGLKHFHTVEENNLTRFAIDFIVATYKYSLPEYFISFDPDADHVVTLACRREHQKVFMKCLMESL